jgi:peroxiredoxin/mono/diheme cytochrome c family protein
MTHAVTILFSVLLPLAQADPGGAAPAVDDFSLQDPRGAKVTLRSYTDRGPVVLVFLGADCPISRRYIPTLQNLHAQYQPAGVEFIGVNSNSQDSDAEVVRFATDFQIPFPVVKDPGAAVAAALGVDRTPTAVLIDKNRRRRYRGRIDNQYELDFDRPSATSFDLIVAIAELLADRPIGLPTTAVSGCSIGVQATPVNSSTVTWHNRVGAVFREHCHKCHRTGRIAPFPLVRYADVEGWGPMIHEAVTTRRMPPTSLASGHEQFEDCGVLTPDEIEAVAAWVQNGCPEGTPTEEFVAPVYTSAWQLSRKPDKIVSISESGYAVPPAGPLEYRYFVVDPGFPNGAKIAGAEILPGAPAVVWQAAVYCLLPGLSDSPQDFADRWDLHSNLLCWFSPGARPIEFPPDAAKDVPPGSKLVFQICYRPCGRAMLDRTSVGLLFADPAKVRRTVQTIPIMDADFSIPAEIRKFTLTQRQTMSEDFDLISLIPRMNLRGRSAQFDARWSAQPPTPLLAVQNFSVYWQPEYRLVDPSPIDQSTVVEYTAVYDNSPDNPINPDPLANVRSGRRIADELMIGYLEVIPRLRTTVAEDAAAGRLRDSTRDISMALGGLATVALVCLSLLWLKPVSSRPAPTAQS